MIELINVTKQYGDKVLFKNITFKFEKGKIYMLKGENGCGKSTLLNIIAGYEKPDAGQVIIERDFKMGYVFQDNLLFHNLTAEDNLYLKYLAMQKDNDTNFKELKEEIFRILNLNKIKDKKVSQLSGGEKKRLMFAQVLLSNPQIIMLDELFSYLDNDTKKILWNF